MKALLALLSAAFLSSAAPSPQAPNNGFFIPLDLIVRVDCQGSDFGVRGSGSFIDANRLLTASHVVHNRTCYVKNMQAKVVYDDPVSDVAVLETPFRAPGRISISCVAQKAGDEAFAVGFAHGIAFVVQRYTAAGDSTHEHPFEGMRNYRGMSYPGMSGGPVLDRLGNLVGILNAGSTWGSMLSRSTVDMWLCKDNG